MSDRSGQLLGNYRLVRLLGQGGFSDVYLGEHVHLNTYAAIKILRTQLAEDGIDNFRTEARTLAHLKHPNIVQVLDFGVEGMTPYLIMQYAPNSTLRQRHPRGVPVALNVVVSYVTQMASALQYAHNQKLIHRDIKPENMLIGEQNQVLLSDFGIAVVTASVRAADPTPATASWSMAGTVSYMAPEQIQGQTVPSSDQYALAIVVYEWLTGVLPFHGSYMEVVSQQISAPPASLREKVPSLSPEVEQVILTALNKDPQRRFGRIEAFANALKQAAQNAPVAVVAADPSKNSEVSKMEAALISSLGRTVIGSTKVTIGRASDNMIVLSDTKVSSHHAEVRPEGPYYKLVDLGSMNGTFVNEQQVSGGMPRLLQPRDTIRIGDTKFTFEVSSTPQGFSYSDGSTVRATPLPRVSPLDNAGATPNFAGNTSYGMGNANYGDQLNYQETLPAQSPSPTPPFPPYPNQQPAYTPSQPPYPNQQPAYTPSQPPYPNQQPAYTPSQPPYPNQQPAYTPSQPPYPNQQPAYTPSQPPYPNQQPAYTPSQPPYPNQQPAYTPSQPPYPNQQPAYTPSQPPYVSETQMPTYIPSSYGQSGQQPSYTPSQPPNFTAPQLPSQPLPSTPMPPVYTPQPSQPQKRSPVRTILLAVIALVVVLAGVGSVFIYHNNQVAQENSNATATVQTSHANATATALTKQNATATAFASTNLTATAIATSHYPPFTNVQLNDSLTGSSSAWDSSSICQFASAGYQVSLAQTNTLQYCLNTGATFGDSAYQVSMSIQQGDCGGLIFRRIDNNNFFFSKVCQDGTYNLGNYVNNQENTLYPTPHSSSAIQQGLNKLNVIAITVQGDTVNMYVNGNHIDTATVQVLTSSTFSQGAIGLMADDAGNPTTVVYTNALVWTAS